MTERLEKPQHRVLIVINDGTPDGQRRKQLLQKLAYTTFGQGTQVDYQELQQARDPAESLMTRRGYDAVLVDQQTFLDLATQSQIEAEIHKVIIDKQPFGPPVTFRSQRPFRP